MSNDTPHVAEGTFRARAVGGGLAESKGGNPQAVVEFALLDEGWVGTRITWYGAFTEKTEKWTIEGLRNAGWSGDDLSNLEGLGSRECEIVVQHEPREDGTGVRAKVRWVNAGGPRALKAPMKADAAKAFAAKMKGKVVAITKSMGQLPKSGDAGNDEPPF
jgi:hypothetical protein